MAGLCCLNNADYNRTMAIKFGYYYHLIMCDSHDNRVILEYTKGGYRFRRVSPYSLHLENPIPSMSYYSFDYPVIFNDHGNYISDIVFLSKIPIRSKDHLTNKGFELYCPFLSERETSNPYSSTSLSAKSISLLSGQYLDATVYYDGKDLFPLPPFHVGYDIDNLCSRVFDIDAHDYADVFFTHIGLVVFILNKMDCSLRRDLRMLSGFKFFGELGLGKDFFTFTKTLKEYISSIDIEKIVSDLSVSYETYCRHKNGEGFISSYYCTKTVSDPIARLDVYLNDLIELGKRGGDTDSDFNPVYSNDILQGERLEKEKRRIIDLYSPEDHLIYLMGEYLSGVAANLLDKNWTVALHEHRKCLFESFQLKQLSNKNRSFEQLFYPLQSRYCKNPDEIIDHINQSISDTTCSFDNDELYELCILK